MSMLLKQILLSRLSLDTLQSDMNDLKKSLSTITLSLEKASQDLQQHMQGFIKVCYTANIKAFSEFLLTWYLIL
jgi:hypothetical protein